MRLSEIPVAKVEKFMDKYKAESYVEMLNEMFNSLKSFIRKMTIKVHYFHSYLLKLMSYLNSGHLIHMTSASNIPAPKELLRSVSGK